MEEDSNKVVELHKVYDSINKKDQICGIGLNYDANENCTISFTVPKDMDPPVLIYYELTNFHQNHRFYSSSRDDFQLVGVDEPQTNISASMCDPLNKLGNMTLNPCGLIANTFFNDVIELVDGSVDDVGEPLKMILRPGTAAYLEDGNRRVRYLYLYGDLKMNIPLAFVLCAEGYPVENGRPHDIGEQRNRDQTGGEPPTTPPSGALAASGDVQD